MKRFSGASLAVALLCSGSVAVAEVPVTASVANCELHVRATNGPVNALVDLTVQKFEQRFGDNIRFTEKIRTTATGTASARVKLRQLFPGKDIDGLWGVSVDIGVTSVRVSGCSIGSLPSTSTSSPMHD